MTSPSTARSALFPVSGALTGQLHSHVINLDSHCIIPRFPCTRAAALDLFKEGDFDYPYRLKQLDRVSQYVYYYISQLSYLDTAAQCMPKSIYEPTRDAVYLDKLSNPYLYLDENFDNFDAGEAAFVAELANSGDTTAAATAAATAFVASGGVFVDPADPSGPRSGIPTGDAEFMANLGLSIATAAGTVSSLTEQLAPVAQRYFAFGYWYRPAYGSHPLAASELSEADILEIYDDALKAAVRSDVTATNCILHNMDTTTRNGEVIRSCFQVWSSTFSPPELATGDARFDGNGKLTSVNAQRTAINNYNPVSS